MRPQELAKVLFPIMRSPLPSDTMLSPLQEPPIRTFQIKDTIEKKHCIRGERTVGRGGRREDCIQEQLGTHHQPLSMMYYRQSEKGATGPTKSADVDVKTGML